MLPIVKMEITVAFYSFSYSLCILQIKAEAKCECVHQTDVQCYILDRKCVQENSMAKSKSQLYHQQ